MVVINGGEGDEGMVGWVGLIGLAGKVEIVGVVVMGLGFGFADLEVFITN